MSDNTLAVKITADIVEMQTKFAIAQAQVRGLTSEMNKLATASAKGIIDTEGSARLQQVAGDLLHARTETASLAGAMEAAGVSVGGFGGRMGEAQLHVGTMAREMRRLFTEVSAGSGGAADVTLIRLAQHLLGLGPAALIGVGAVAGLAAGLGYLIYQAISASNALDRIHIGAEFAGNMDLSREKIKEFADQLSQSSDISSKDALKIADSIARIPGMTIPAMQALANEMGALTGESGKTADQMGTEVARMMSAGESAEKVARSFGGVTQEQINAAQAADRSGDASLVMAAKLQTLQQATERARTSLDQHNASMTASWKNTIAYSLAVGEEASMEDIEANMLSVENTKRAENNRLIEQNISLLRSTPPAPEQTLKTGVEVATKENPISQQMEEAKTKIKEMDAALLVAKADGDKLDINLLNASLVKARENLSALQFGPVLERMRADMAQVASSWDGTQSGLLEKQRQVAAQVLGEVRKNSKEYLAVQTEMAHLDVQIRQTAGQELIAVVRTQNAAINGDVALSATQRLERERDSWVGILASDRLTTAQRLEVQREFNSASAALAKALEAQKQAIAKSDTDTNIAIARMSIEAEKQALDQKLQLNQVSAAKKLSLLKDLTNAEHQLNLAELQTELAMLHQGTAEYERVYNQIRELKAKLNLDLAALDRQAAADAARQAKEEVTAWKSAVAEIENAEGTMLSDLMNHRKTFAQAAQALIQTVIQKEIENDIKAMTTRLLLGRQEEVQKKALEQGGFLSHQQTLQQQAAADAANDAKETATKEAAINAQTAAVTAAQTAQTAAVVAGTTARTTAQTTADTANMLLARATGIGLISIYAADAGAGATAEAAPTEGAGAVATGREVWAETMTYAALPGLDVGAWEIPGTMLAMLHQGESVMPRPFASEFRTAVAGGGQGSGQGRTGRAQRGTMNLNLQVDRNTMRYSIEDLLRSEFAAIQAGARN